MGKRRRIIIIAVVALLLGGAGWIILHSQSTRLIQGKTEAEWIKSINYNGDDAETKRWRALGPEGIEMLITGLNSGNGPMESRYPGFWASMPAWLRNRLPKPVNTYPTRMCAISMLHRLLPDSTNAIPALAKALKVEKASGVKLGIIGFFSYENNVLKGREKEKAELLPEFIAAMQSNDSAIRNNAVLALANYPERADVVVPVLLKAVNDSNVQVQMVATSALQRVDPKTAARDEVVQVLIGILKNPDDQVAYRAPGVLGKLGSAASAAVPALIEAAHGTNRLVANAAASALKKIDPKAAAEAGLK